MEHPGPGLFQMIERLPKQSACWIGFGIVLVVSIADRLIPQPYSFSIFYIVAVTLVGWVKGFRCAAVIGVIAAGAVTWLQASNNYSLPALVWNLAGRGSVYLLIGWGASQLGQLTRELEAKVAARTTALKKADEERMETLKRLTEAVDRFEQVTNSVTQMFWLAEPGFSKVVYVSPIYETIWGRPRQELEIDPKSWLAPVHPEDLAGVMLAIEKMQSEAVHVQFRLRTPNGQIRWVQGHAFPLRDSKGKVFRIAGTAEDITERKNAEEELARTKELYSQIVNHSPGASYVAPMVPPFSATFITDNLREVLGYEASDFLNDPKFWLTLIHPEDEGIVEQGFKDLLTTGEIHMEYRMRHRDGVYRWILDHSKVAKPGTGAEGELVGFMQDVTEQKTTQLALQQKEEQSRVMLATAMDGFIMLDAAARIVEVNQAYCALTGFSRDELRTRTLLDVESDETVESIAGILRSIRSTGGARFETRHRLKDGGTVDIEVSASSPPDSKGVIYLFVRDVTQRHQSEFVLRLQKEVAAGLSTATGLQSALRWMLEKAMQIKGVECGGIYVRNPQSRGLRLAAHAGLSDRFIESIGELLPDAYQYQMASQCRPIYSDPDEGLFQELAEEKLTALAAIPLTHEGTLVGCLNLASRSLREFPPFTRALIESIASQAAGAILRMQAEEERSQLQEQILGISDREQARIGQEIHDELCQQLVGLAFDANTLEQQLSESASPLLRTARRLAGGLDEAITESRRVSRGLFPVRLEMDGLGMAIEELAKATAARFKLNCIVEVQPITVAHKKVAVNLYRITQEALNNVGKHSAARNVKVTLVREGSGLNLEVRDDGSGLAQKAERGMGLHIMDYRARSIGAKLQVDAQPGRGTAITCLLPVLADNHDLGKGRGANT